MAAAGGVVVGAGDAGRASLMDRRVVLRAARTPSASCPLKCAGPQFFVTMGESVVAAD